MAGRYLGLNITFDLENAVMCQSECQDIMTFGGHPLIECLCLLITFVIFFLAAHKTNVDFVYNCYFLYCRCLSAQKAVPHHPACFLLQSVWIAELLTMLVLVFGLWSPSLMWSAVTRLVLIGAGLLCAKLSWGSRCGRTTARQGRIGTRLWMGHPPLCGMR